MSTKKQENNLTIKKHSSKESMNKKIVICFLKLGQYTKKQSNLIGESLGNFRNRPLEERQKEQD